MSAFSTVDNVFTDQNSRHLTTLSCGLGALEEANRECGISHHVEATI